MGQGTADWSPEGNWIVTGGTSDVQGQGLFKIPVDGGEPVRLVPGEAYNPVWSPKDDLIVYAITLRPSEVGRAPWCEIGRQPRGDPGGAGSRGWSPSFPARR